MFFPPTQVLLIYLMINCWKNLHAPLSNLLSQLSLIVYTVASQWEPTSYCSLKSIYSHGKKPSTPHVSVACRATFSSNKSNELLSVWLYLSVRSLWRNLALLQFIEVHGHLFMHSSLKVPPQDFNAWTVAAWRFISFFGHSVMDSLLCSGFQF